MFNNRRAIVALASVFVVALFLPEAWAEPEGTPPTAGTQLRFGDAAHAPFFNYQRHLASLGQPSESEQTWRLLAGPERLRKVKEGEARLERLRAELLAKKSLSAEEAALLRAVWGMHHGTPATTRGPLDGPDASPAAAVGRLTTKVKPTSDWNRMFDGGKTVAGPGAVVVAEPLGGSAASPSPIAGSRIKRKLDDGEVAPPPSGERSSSPSNRGLLVFGGALLLGGAALALKARRSRPDAGEDHVRMLADEPGKPQATAAPGCTTFCEAMNCQTSCQTGCQDACRQFGCQLDCKLSCKSMCQISCQVKA